MDTPEPILSVAFFRTETGREPVREWLKSLPRENRRIIGEDIKTVQFGWPLGIPPMEDFYIGGASMKLFLPIFKMNFPEIVDIALPAEGVFHNLVFVGERTRRACWFRRRAETFCVLGMCPARRRPPQAGRPRSPHRSAARQHLHRRSV
jgi:hypothetical protein